MKTINTITFLLSILASVALTAQPEPIPHTEGFDDPGNSSWNGTGWTIAISQANVAGEDTETYLVGPVFDFSSLTQLPGFSFFYGNNNAGDLGLEVIVDGGTPLEIWSIDLTTSGGFQGIVDVSNSNYQMALGASSVQFRFKALVDIIAFVNDIQITESQPPGSAYNITYTYDPAGNRNGRTSELNAFVMDDEEISQIEKELSTPFASLDDESLYDEGPLSNSSFSVHPNPTHQYINVTTIRIEDEFSVTLYDAVGKKLSSRNLSGQQTQFDLSRNIPGIYYVAIESKSDRLIYKVIKQ